MHENTDYTQNETPTSAANLECIRTRGISIKKNYLGEVINYQDTVTQTFEIFFINPVSNQDLGKWISMINNYSDLGTWQAQINLYGIKIDNCRITSQNIPTSENSMEDAVGRGRIRLEIEQRICGDVSSIQNHQYYEGIHAIFTDPDVCPYLDAVSEEFSFDYGKGEQVSLSHTVNITPFDSCPTGVEVICYQCLDEDGNQLGTVMSGGNIGCVLSDCKTKFPTTTSVAVLSTPTPTTGIATTTSSPTSGGTELCWECRDSFLNKSYGYIMTTDSGGGSGEKRNVNSAVALCAEKICTIDYEELGGYADMQECLDAAAANPTVIEIDISNCQPCNGGVNSVGGVAQPGIKAPTPVCRPGQYDIDKALTLARQMLDFNIPNFGLAFNPGQYSDLHNKNVLCYYSETQNLITGEASMTKKISLLSKKDEELDWTADYKHSFVVNPNGIVKVTESGKVKGNKKFTGDGLNVSDKAYDRTKQGLEEVLEGAGNPYGGAALRCAEVYSKHVENFTGPFDDWDDTKPNWPMLSTTFPLEITKNFNNIGRDVSYSITFTDDPNMFLGYFASRTLTASKNSSGVVTVVEKSDLTQFQEKGSDDDCDGSVDNPLFEIYPTDVSGSSARVTSFYESLEDFTVPDDGCDDPLKLMSRDIGYNPKGRDLNYSITYSGDKSVSCEYPDKNGIRKTETSTNDKLPQRIHKEHPIANWKMLVHDAQQTDLGERSVTIKVDLDRIPKNNRLSNPKLPTRSLKHIVSLAEPELKEVFDDNVGDNLVPDDMYIKLCQWSFDSKGDASFTVAINYLQAR
ncbi:MAG: hypothetical protein CMI54_06535 [Parcubacteria group bacterium]|nr:hypothetical protein [Parcubacteria group bacterium]|tara:strand:+ start:4186 stop:6585 length:2400 start_codon:yes stop_codon:yes gene_type:complete